MNAVLAVALGLAPVKPGNEAQIIHYRAGDYAGLIGRYSQSIDRRGTTHLRGFDRISGRAFDIAVDENGHVEGSVGDMYVTFHVSEGT